MLKRLNSILVTATLVALPVSVMAEDLALVITNGNYPSGVSSRAVSRQHSDLTDAYAAQGYEVIDGRNMDADAMRDALESFIDRVDGKDRIIVHFSGRAVHLNDAAWLLPIDVTPDSLLGVDYDAPSLDVILEVLGQRPGRGMLFFGEYDAGRVAAPLDASVGDVTVPQGVLFVHGPQGELTDVVIDELLQSDASIATVLDREGGGLIIEGFASPDISMNGSGGATTPVPSDWANLLAEQALWAVADRSGSQDDLQAYIDRFPNGVFAQAARARLEALDVPDPDEVENALRLSRTSKRSIQTNLTLLGYDTRGIDGVFGRGSRAAISAWQRSEGHETTGYMNAAQVSELQELADTKRAINARDDRRYWNATGNSGKKDDLELYLERYPAGGIYTEEAKASLAVIVAEERRAADQDAWNFAVGLNSQQSYRDYLREYPRGTYADVARRRLDEFEPTPEEPTDTGATNVARETEQRLNLNKATRLLVEGRLRGLGFQPGNVDGNFNRRTRGAIRQYQRSKNMPATGFLNTVTLQGILLG